MRLTILLLLMVLPLGGCTHRIAIGGEPTPADMAQFAEHVADYPAVARFVSGDSMPVGPTLSLGPTALFHGGPNTEEMIPLRQIESIRFRSRQDGAWNGAGIGLLVGSGLGTIGGLANLCTDCSQAGFVAVFAGLYGLAGLAVGSAVGALIGSTYEYTLDHQPEPAERTGGPGQVP